MDVEELALFAFQRVNAHEGLAIDADTWNAAHSYHQRSQQLHALALHGWGIVAGLRVTAADPPDRTVIVGPGLAIDRDGNVIRVPQPLRLEVRHPGPGPACVVLRYAETSLPAPANTPPSRVDEGFELVEAVPPLRPRDIEVARVEISDSRTLIGTAEQAWDPAVGEVDERFRRELRPTAADTLTIGRLVAGEGGHSAVHRQGLINAVRDLQLTAPFAVQYAGDVRAEQAIGQCDLLYVSGAGELRLTPREGASLLGFMRGGGVLFAEPCVEAETRQQENGRFVSAFQRLMTDLKYGLREVTADHPLLRARHIFGLPPDGVGGHAPILSQGGVILNPNDYGCCWQGGMTGKPLPRETIRGALEFASNLAWYTAQGLNRTGAVAGANGKAAQPALART